MSAELAVEMLGVEKRYGGVHALKGVDLRVPRGSVHALLGENGAGKSTLMKILMGLTRPDSGQLRINGSAVDFHSTREARDHGISMIFQELNTVGHLSVADNIFLGREPRIPLFGLINKGLMRSQAASYLERLRANISPDDFPCNLSVANTQLIEIAKAVSFNAKIIVMDEPTSALSDVETANLFRIIRELSAEGVTVIYISHKLDEIFEICDGITVLRDGINTGEAAAASVARNDLISMMVGREVKELFPKEESVIGEAVLEVTGLTRAGEFSEIDFSVRRGEILGIAGLMGAGRTEIAETIFGLRRADAGAIKFNGKPLQVNSPHDAIAAGIALVPEDRKNVGLMLRLSVRDNILVSSLDKCMGPLLLDAKIEQTLVAESLARLAIKTPDPMNPCASLSGGNQQKVVIAKCLLLQPKLIILDEPTRGIDVKTKSQIHALMSKFAKEGGAVVMISSELPEVLGMSDRIVVLHEGRVSGELMRAEATPERVISLAMGGNK